MTSCDTNIIIDDKKDKKKETKSKYIYDPNIIGKHSKFNIQLFEKYDIPARNIIKQKLGEFVNDNPNELQQDLIINDPKCKYKFIELQVCTNWTGDTYPHDFVYIFARKYKYDSTTLFITLDRFFTRGYIFDAHSFKNVTPRRLKKYSREYIYDIPWGRVLHFYVEHFTWDDVLAY
jgi:hypothetical protein